MEMNKRVEELLQTPLLIATIKDRKLLEQLNSLIPYSTGFEIESNLSSLYNEENFTSIPYIMDVQCDSYEQRFRIPNGIRGIICLYLISRQLRINMTLNEGSGIHYHVDCTDVDFNGICLMAQQNAGYIIDELMKWRYDRSYNLRGVGYSNYWLKFNTLNTFEFRIGEMTFDYSILLKRIIHVNAIVRYLKEKVGTREPHYEWCDFKMITAYMKTPYSKAAYQKGSVQNKIVEVRRQIEKLEETKDEPITIRNRKHTI